MLCLLLQQTDDVHNDAVESDITNIIIPAAETGGCNTVTAKVVELNEFPPNAVVLTLNVNPWKAGLNIFDIDI